MADENGYPDGEGLIPERFDERTVIFLVRPPDAPEFSEEELDTAAATLGIERKR